MGNTFIKRIALEFFQAHLDSELILHPGLNVVIGENDIGKSSIGRGFKWLAKNSITGFSFRSTFAKKKNWTRFIVEDSDGNVCSRERRIGPTSTYNRYKLNGAVFKAVGKFTVPEEVSSFINLSKHNIQLQHDHYSLLQDPPMAVARTLNAVSGLESIDFLFSYINKTERDASLAIKVREREIVELKAGIEEYSSVSRHVDAIGILEKSILERVAYKDERTAIFSLRRDFSVLQMELDSYSVLDEIEEKAGDLFKLADGVANDKATLSRITELVNDFEEIGSEIEDIDEVLGGNETVLATVRDDIRKTKKMLAAKRDLVALIADFEVLVAETRTLDSEIQRLEEEYEEEMGFGICPLCGRDF